MLKVGYALLGVIVVTLGLMSELRATDTVSFSDVWASLSQSCRSSSKIDPHRRVKLTP